MRGLENVAAGIEDEVRRLARRRQRCGALTQPLQRGAVELQPRQRGDVPAGLAEFRHAVAATLGQVEILPPHRATRHRQEEARIDAIIARLDAGAAQHAGTCPLTRRFRSVAGPDQVDHAGNHGSRIGFGDAGGLNAGADLDALAASGAGIEHVADAIVQRGFKAEFGHGQTLQRIAKRYPPAGVLPTLEDCACVRPGVAENSGLANEIGPTHRVLRRSNRHETCRNGIGSHACCLDFACPCAGRRSLEGTEAGRRRGDDGTRGRSVRRRTREGLNHGRKHDHAKIQHHGVDDGSAQTRPLRYDNASTFALPLARRDATRSE